MKYYLLSTFSEGDFEVLLVKTKCILNISFFSKIFFIIFTFFVRIRNSLSWILEFSLLKFWGVKVDILFLIQTVWEDFFF